MTVNVMSSPDSVTLGIEPSQKPGDTEEGINLVVIFGILNLGRRKIAAVTFACLAMATAVAFLLPPRYTSDGAIIPPSSGSTTGAALAGQLSALGASSLLGGVAKNPSDLYVGILKSRSIAQEMVKRYRLTDVYKVKESKAEKILANNTVFEIGTKDSIIHISVTDTSPSRARDMARSYYDILRETNDRLALSESSQRRAFFQQQLAKEKDELEDAEVELKKTEEVSGLIAPSGQTSSQIQAIAATRSQLAQRQVQLAALRQSATDQNPDLIRLRSEIASLTEQLINLQNGGKQGNRALVPNSMVPALQLEYVRREREVKYHTSLFEILAKQYEAARLDEAHDAPVLQMLDDPSYPDTKSGPHRMLIVLVGALLGVSIGCVWVLLRDYLHELRSSPEWFRQ